MNNNYLFPRLINYYYLIKEKNSIYSKMKLYLIMIDMN
jgi:hypothetical protein